MNNDLFLHLPTILCGISVIFQVFLLPTLSNNMTNLEIKLMKLEV